MEATFNSELLLPISPIQTMAQIILCFLSKEFFLSCLLTTENSKSKYIDEKKNFLDVYIN